MIFPSKEHDAQLARQLKDIGLANMHADDRRQYHAYVYAQRAVRLGLAEARSPIDPAGEWYDARLVRAARKIYERPPAPRPVENPPPADPQLAARFARQDRERAVMNAMITGDGTNRDGSPTQEVLDKIELCREQMLENAAIMDQRHKAVFSVFDPAHEDENRAALAELQAELGVAAAEQKAAEREEALRQRSRLCPDDDDPALREMEAAE